MLANLLDNQQSFEIFCRTAGRGSNPLRMTTSKPFNAQNYFMTNPSLSGRGKSLKSNAPKLIADRLARASRSKR
jgi:polyphosphate kinase